MAKLTNRDLSAAYENAFPGGVNTKGQRIDARKFFDYWRGKEDTQLRDKLRADVTSSGVYADFREQQKPEGKPAQTPGTEETDDPGQTAEEDILDKPWTEGMTDKAMKEYAQEYYASYGVVPDSLKEYLTPDVIKDIDTSKSLYTTGSKPFQQTMALSGQNLADSMAMYNNAKDKAIADWDQLIDRIGSGAEDIEGEEFMMLQRNLTAQTEAVLGTKRSLSSRGTLYGGVAQKAVGDVQTAYGEQATDIGTTYGQMRGTGQTTYDAAMQTYLTGKEQQTTQYGVEGGQAGGSGLGLDWGGGKWNPANQSFENIQWGLTPEQAQAQGLKFFGTDPYSAWTGQQDLEAQLGVEFAGGASTATQQAMNAYYNY